MTGKIEMMKIGMSLFSHIEPILNEVVEIKGVQEHGKQELIQSNEKSFAIYREVFESEDDAKHFVAFCNRMYALKKGQLPPIHTLIILFKSMLPILTPQELKGEQTHGKPEIKKSPDGKHHTVILKEVFTKKEDAVAHLKEADRIKSMRL